MTFYTPPAVLSALGFATYEPVAGSGAFLIKPPFGMTYTTTHEPPPDRFRTGDWWRTRSGLLCRVRGGTVGLQGFITLDPINGTPSRHFREDHVTGFTRQSWGGKR